MKKLVISIISILSIAFLCAAASRTVNELDYIVVTPGFGVIVQSGNVAYRVDISEAVERSEGAVTINENRKVTHNADIIVDSASGRLVLTGGILSQKSVTTAPIIQGLLYNGSLDTASATPVLSGQTIGNFRFGGWDGSIEVVNAGLLRVLSTEDWTATAHGAKFQFRTANNGKVGATTKMVIEGDNIGILTNSPAATLDVNGNFKADLSGGAQGANPTVWFNTTTKELLYDTSALKYKENVRDIGDTSWIYDLVPRIFDEKNGLRTNIIGLIAEEVAQVNPDFIFYKPAKKQIMVIEKNENDEDIEVEKTVDDLENMQIEGVAYQQLIIPMLKELQRLRAELDILKGQ